MSSRGSTSRKLRMGLLFAGPNIIGFLAFTLLPMVFSLVLAFSNWDVKRHNPFKTERLEFVGLANFQQLFSEPDFLRFLGNTVYMMLGIPLAVAASLVSAILLTQDMSITSVAQSRKRRRMVLAATVAGVALVASSLMLALAGYGASTMMVLITGIASGTLVGGLLGGKTVYRTLFYLPSFTSGIAVFILWKRMYNSQTGPINAALRPMLDGLAQLVNQSPAWIFAASMWLSFALMLCLFAFALKRIRISWRDGDAGSITLVLAGIVLFIPWLVAGRWGYTQPQAMPLLIGAIAVMLWQVVAIVRYGCDFHSRLLHGLGSMVMLAAGAGAAMMALLGLAPVIGHLPAMAADGSLQPPNWLGDYHWAKPALMIMGFWTAIGSQNMLLYIAALGNVPQELYEAADIDGASRFQRFWNVTWPQLAPTTFFIVVMSVIGGLQGGFETARTMTEGGPAGSTTTLAYYIYI